MINIEFVISNPCSDRFENIKYWYGLTSFKHKFWELQIMKTNCIIGFQFDLSHACDHAGLRFNLGLLGFEIEYNFYDNRHYNKEGKQWRNI